MSPAKVNMKQSFLSDAVAPSDQISFRRVMFSQYDIQGPRFVTTRVELSRATRDLALRLPDKAFLTAAPEGKGQSATLSFLSLASDNSGSKSKKGHDTHGLSHA